MSRRNIIIFISILFVLIVGGLFFLFSKNSGTSSTSQTAQTAVNPFGTAPSSVSGGASTGGTGFGNTAANNTTTFATSSAQLLELYKSPIAGSILFQNTSKQNVIRFIDRPTGNVYEYLPDAQVGDPVRITNTTIPKVQEAVWSSIGDSAIMRYNDGGTDDIVSFAAKVGVAASSSGNVGSLSGSFLTPNITELVASPQTSSAFGLVETNDGSGVDGILYSFDGKTKKQIFNSPVTQWNISWPTANTIAFTTKSNSTDYGYLYFFNIVSQSFTKILSNLAGISTITNNNASFIAYSQSQGNGVSLDVYDVKNQNSQGLGIATFADKCVWGVKDNTVLYCAIPQNIPAGTYPDNWYQGLVSFSDNLWMIDTKTESATLLYQTDPTQNQIDAEYLQISSDDQYITFMNKADLTFWLLHMNQ